MNTASFHLKRTALWALLILCVSAVAFFTITWKLGYQYRVSIPPGRPTHGSLTLTGTRFEAYEFSINFSWGSSPGFYTSGGAVPKLWAGFGWLYEHASAYGLAHIGVFMPPWFLIGTFGAAGMLAGRRLRQAVRETGRLCTKCNYDLRAHKPGQKCPECGTEIPPSAGAPPNPSRDRMAPP